MKKAKYTVLTPTAIFESNSRNARKHLIEGGYDSVIVVTNKGYDNEIISQAVRQTNGIILVGAKKN